MIDYPTIHLDINYNKKNSALIGI